MKAIGMIETRGLIPAIESADAMLKAAEVTLIERRFVKGGLVTIIVAGDVAACKASVDAAASSVQRMGGEIVSTHVIPRPHASLSGLIVNRIPEDGEQLGGDDDEESHIGSHKESTNEGGGQEASVIVEESEPEEAPEADAQVEESIEEVKEETPEEPAKKAPVVVEGKLSREALDAIVAEHGVDAIQEALGKIKVVDLRTLAREYNGEFGIEGREITRSNKKALIEQFETYYKK